MSAAALAITDPAPLLALPPADGVDLWVALLADGDQPTDSLMLDGADKQRFDRIIPPLRRRNFLFRRAVQRHVLRHYARSYRIRFSPAGKPYVTGTDRALHFNASSSHAYCAVAVSAGAVGVDIVAASVGIDLAGVCARFVAMPDSVGGGNGAWQWARFEAGIKLRGGTLSHALGRAALPRPRAELVVAEPGFVCAVSKAESFRLTRFACLSFAEVIADAR